MYKSKIVIPKWSIVVKNWRFIQNNCHFCKFLVNVIKITIEHTLLPGGKKALISSNLIDPKTESFGFELVDSCLETVVDVELGLSDLNSLGGFGRLRLGLKSDLKSSGKSFSRSSCSMLDKISSIKLASVLVLVVDSSNLNPGGRNFDTSSETIFVVAGFL